MKKLSDNQFSELVEKYQSYNNSCSQKIIFHVGTGAGFYSELGAMLECILYCYHNQIAFSLYADKANFADSKGWEEFFVPFCELSHQPLNIKGNYRYKYHYRWRGMLIPNIFLRRFFYPYLLKKKTGTQLLTQDVFREFTSDSFKAVSVDWPDLGINGTVGETYALLRNFAMRPNETTQSDIETRINALNLPKNYISIQIRSGDKSLEFDELVDVDYCISQIVDLKLQVKDLFVFTDDYRNIIKMREARPDWNIYTLTGEDERGYFNSNFYQQDWAHRRSNLIKLFAMVEICIRSDFHVGYFGACVSAFIGSAKGPSSYVALRRGSYKKRNLKTFIKSVFNDLLHTSAT